MDVQDKKNSRIRFYQNRADFCVEHQGYNCHHEIYRKVTKPTYALSYYAKLQLFKYYVIHNQLLLFALHAF